MAEAPAGDEPLTPDDAVNVLEEILEAQNQSRFLGLKLNVPNYIVTGIHKQYTDPKERLYYVLLEFLQQNTSRPTWRAIVAALRSPAVNLPQLAMRVETAHCPDPTPSRDSHFPDPTDSTATIATDPMIIESEIREFENRFNALKKSTRECLERLGVPVKRVAEALTSLPADGMDNAKKFLKNNKTDLYQAPDHYELFGTMNFHWNYQNYQLLDHLIREFDLEEVKGEMKTYKEDLQQFRKKTPLKLFCQAQKQKHIKPPPDFHEVVAEFNWPDDVTLDVVEEFRQGYAGHYNLRECAMMLAVVRPCSFIITWYIPGSIVEKLKVEVPTSILKKYSVTKLEIAGECVYPKATDKMSTTPSSSPATGLDTADTPRRISVQLSMGRDASQVSLAEQDFLFVEQPSENFFCPVTYGLLLQPHLTACCGNHLSQEAAMRIQGEGGACPLCKKHLSTVLNKHFLREVNKLRVFCHHKERGCEWQGKLSNLVHHLQSCPYSDLSRKEKTSGAEQDRTRHPLHETKEVLSYTESTPIPSSTTNERYSDGDVTSETGQDRTRYQIQSHVLQTPQTNTSSTSEQQSGSYTCRVSGPGLQSATANHPTHVIVELTDSSNRPCSVPQKVIAQLELISKATPTSPSMKPPAVHVAVATTSPSQYEVSYTAISRGQHKLHVRLNDIEINGSPFTMTVYPDPTQLVHPVRVVTDLNHPYGIAVNSRGEMIVSERGKQCHQIAIFDIRGQRIRTFGSYGYSPEQMNYPAGVAIDDMDNIYVTSLHRLQKFTSSGELIKCVGQEGSKEGEFNELRGLALYNNQAYICDHDSNCIQVFDLDLNFIRSIGSRGKGRGEFKAPFDVKFDTAGHMYVTEIANYRLQVMDKNGQFIGIFGENRLCKPSGLHIVDKYVYVSDYRGDCIVVYETSGQFVTSFGGRGPDEGKFWIPYGITSCANGYIYVCDYLNDRVQIF